MLDPSLAAHDLQVSLGLEQLSRGEPWYGACNRHGSVDRQHVILQTCRFWQLAPVSGDVERARVEHVSVDLCTWRVEGAQLRLWASLVGVSFVLAWVACGHSLAPKDQHVSRQQSERRLTAPRRWPRAADLREESSEQPSVGHRRQHRVDVAKGQLLVEQWVDGEQPIDPR